MNYIMTLAVSFKNENVKGNFKTITNHVIELHHQSLSTRFFNVRTGHTLKTLKYEVVFTVFS